MTAPNSSTQLPNKRKNSSSPRVIRKLLSILALFLQSANSITGVCTPCAQRSIIKTATTKKGKTAQQPLHNPITTQAKISKK